MPEKEMTAIDGNRMAAYKQDHDDIIPPALPLGNCISCGQRIRLDGGATTCRTCAAWRRWAAAHRIASAALREAMR